MIFLTVSACEHPATRVAWRFRIIVDGLASGVAALMAARLLPAAKPYLALYGIENAVSEKE